MDRMFKTHTNCETTHIIYYASLIISSHELHLQNAHEPQEIEL